MALLQLCTEIGLKVEVAHANFKLRGSESDADAALVKEVCAGRGIPCHIRELPIDKSKAKDGVQAEARKLRYAWFHGLLEERGCGALLTAHHLNDRVETFFMHLMRGSGLRGLRSIPRREGHALRPLLDWTRGDLEAYANAQGLRWREDASNATDAYLRNRIRQDLMPAFEGLAEHGLEATGRSMDFLEEAHQLMLAQAETFADEWIQALPAGMEALPLRALDRLADSGTLRKYFFERYSFGPAKAEEVMALRHSQSGRMCAGSHWEAWRDRERILFCRKAQVERPVQYLSQPDGSFEAEISLRWHVLEAGEIAPSPNPQNALLDLSLLEWPLLLRPWQPGDRFVPSGMRGSKKLSDYLTDLKLSVPEKRHVWVLCSGEDVCWVPGYRVDERYRWKGEAEAVLFELQ